MKKNRKPGSGIHNGARGRKKGEASKDIRHRVPVSIHADLDKVVKRFLKRKIKQYKLKSQK